MVYNTNVSKGAIMAKKYEVTKLDDFLFTTDTQSYNVTLEVDSLEYINLNFGDSFSMRINYDSAENMENALRTARYFIQDQMIDNAGKDLKNSSQTPKDWNPNDPSNW